MLCGSAGLVFALLIHFSSSGWSQPDVPQGKKQMLDKYQHSYGKLYIPPHDYGNTMEL